MWTLSILWSFYTEKAYSLLLDSSVLLLIFPFVGVLCFISYGLSSIKNGIMRWQLCKNLPIKNSSFSIWGDLRNLRKIPEYSNCTNAYMLKIFSTYTELYREKMLFCFFASFMPFVFIVKAKAAEELLSGTKHLEKSWTYRWIMQWLQTGLLTSKGQKWKSRRKLITPAFHFDILKDFLSVINEQSQYLNKLLENETGKDWTDVSSFLSLCTLDVICETTLGVKVNAQKDRESEYVQALFRVSSIVMQRLSNPLYFFDFSFNLSELGRRFNKDVKVLHNFTQAVIKKKKTEFLDGIDKLTSTKKRKTLMDILLEHHLKDGELSEEDIREEVDTFAFAGHDTTAIGISWALYLIGLYKDVQSRLQEELNEIFGNDTERFVTEDDLKHMAYLERVIKESQRLYPSVPLIGRQSTDDTVINGYKIPEGVACLIYIYELHRDPNEFPDPERFDPDRFLPENSIGRHPYAYIPFSAGPRNCIGQRFAMMEEKIIIANILRKYTITSLEPRDKVLPAPEVILRNSKPFKIEIRERMR